MKILHTGDLHLDSPFSSLSGELAQKAKAELRNTFSSMLSYAKEAETDLILISGDLFDSGFATRETAALITRGFESVSCPIIISPGNHDCYSDNSIWKYMSFPDNVYIFSSSELSYFDFPHLGARVYGYAFESPSMKICPLSGKTVEDKSIINILCAHGDTSSPLSLYCPITSGDLVSFEADHAALGHIHNPEAANEALRSKGISAVYCGCPQGRDFGETGIKGALLTEIEKSGEKTQVNTTFIPFSKKVYKEIQLELDGAETTADIISELRTRISEEAPDENTVLRAELCGYISPRLAVVCSEIEEACKDGLCSITVTNNTVPMLSSEELELDRGIRGEVYRLLSPTIENGSKEERNEALGALRYALSALSGENI
ncbi:MAG: DNA repair exonuclease [Clostridia bacterium]|nr:DNA repair exonuclease [Clostridia bacterium]